MAVVQVGKGLRPVAGFGHGVPKAYKKKAAFAPIILDLSWIPRSALVPVPQQLAEIASAKGEQDGQPPTGGV